MYLSELKLWNFRKYGSDVDIVNENHELRDPDLTVPFQNGLNVLIGENDAGKTTIIDAIKMVIKTHSTEWVRIDINDFYEETQRMRIECIFKGLKDEEAMHFTEWIGMDGEGDEAIPYLKVILDVQHNKEKILPFDIKAGADESGYVLTAEAREYLKTTYLKPLRDVQSELVPRKNSRLSQILEGHEMFKGKADDHELKGISLCFDCLTQKYFDRSYKPKTCEKTTCDLETKFLSTSGGEERIKANVNTYVQRFLGEEEAKAKFGVISPKLKNILEGLKLSFDEEYESGLGRQNLLFIAAELLNLDRSNWSGLRLGLIEEIEAHLHPQSQLRVIEYLQDFTNTEREEGRKDIQLIISTHSPNIGSKLDLKNLIICSNRYVYPMGPEYTELDESDYGFLRRFLDITKANLFFAKGVILVEGWSEEILLPVLAKKIGINLTKKGISIINVAGTVFLRYSKIFRRKNTPNLELPVAVITDLDLSPDEEGAMDNGETKKEKKTNKKIQKYDGQKVKTFVSPHWTLEYCIGLSECLRKILYKAIILTFKEQKDYQDETKKKTVNDA
ncbi:AAA family ATPase, partial [Patescibacteria group bacterium]|nr:AAA family ATPase [Patescibacteria group bacterium]